MKEILPGIYHWTTYHEGIGATVHSYLLASVDPPVVLDPRLPKGGLGEIRRIAQPRHILLTNRLHYRHSGRFAEDFSATIHAHEAGRKAFGPHRHRVRLFKHGTRLPGGIRAIKVGALCPEETAYLIPRHGGILSLGDAVIREGNRLAFVPDCLMGEDPKEVKRGLRLALRRLLRYPFKHLLLAHGHPFIDDGRNALERFLK